MTHADPPPGQAHFRRLTLLQTNGKCARCGSVTVSKPTTFAPSREWIDAGDDVIAALQVRARGRHGEVPVERREWHVWTLRDRKLWRLRIFATKTEALEAVGPSESDKPVS